VPKNNNFTHNQLLGRWGESIAADFLLQRGFKLIAQNVRTTAGEIDLIVEKDGKVVFVEVKTRSNTQTVYPEEAVTDEKLEHMLDSAEIYLADHPEISENWRVDVIAIIGHPGSSHPQIEWYEDVNG
jgi:putative endonuclease